MPLLFHLLEVAQEPSGSLSHTFEAGLGYAAGFLKVLLEFLAIAIILYAIVLTAQKFLRLCKRNNFDAVQRILRLELGRYLSLSLEFLLAADIVGTAVSPSWDAIGKLAAISAIRTFLNYFLEREVHQLEMAERDRPDVNASPYDYTPSQIEI